MNVSALVGCLVALSSGAQPRHSETLRLTAIEASPLAVGRNLLDAYGFEDIGADGMPLGWEWDPRATDATCVSDDTEAHSGRRSVRITNGTPFGPHVYGMLLHPTPIRLEPGKVYTYSAWVKSEDPGQLGLITGSDWQHRSYAPKTGKEWRRIWVSFTAGQADAACILRISTESQTKAVWIDDLKLEEGSVPTPVVAADGAAMPPALEAAHDSAEIEADGPFAAQFVMTVPERGDVRLRALIGGAAPFDKVLQMDGGVWRIVVRGACDGAGDAQRDLTLRATGLDGSREMRALQRIRFLLPRNAAARLSVVEKAMPGLRNMLARVRRSGRDPAYPQITMTVLTNFIPYVREDLARNETRRALQQIGDMERMAARVRTEMTEALAGRRPARSVARYTGNQRPRIEAGAFHGPVRFIDGRTVRRPILFTGYGHFAQVVADMEKWPSYGVNIVQVEFGPTSVFPDPDTISEEPIRRLRSVLDRARKAGVAVNLLISPHYFPGWALDKWPHLRKRREGFLNYCLHAPEGQDLLKRFIRTALRPLADHPALHSICLSNEPVNVEEPGAEARKLWAEWLRRRHGDPATLSRRWGAEYESFDDVPLPDPFGPRPPDAVWIDYVRFNQEFFADWHRMLTDAVHEIAPDLPVHAKAMTWTLLNDGEIARYGADATLFGGFSQINGNDSFNAYSFGQGEFAQSWTMNAMGHLLQRAVLDAPVFNSENHLIHDRETRYLPPAHIRAALWQAAVYGQGATTIWVWERTFDPKSDFAGSIMHRAACAEAVGRVNLDLNRLAPEVVALQRAEPQVSLLHSTSGAVRDMGPHGDSLQKVFIALTFSGVSAGFVTERQLEQGIMPRSPVVIVPHIRHLSDAAFRALKAYRGRVVLLGEGDLPGLDEWGHPRTEKLTGAEALPYRYGPTEWRDLRAAILPRLKDWGIERPIALMENARPADGVEWRMASTPAGLLVNLCSQRQTPVRLTLQRNGRPVSGTDLVTGERVAGSFTLQPLEVKLLRVPAP